MLFQTVVHAILYTTKIRADIYLVQWNFDINKNPAVKFRRHIDFISASLG